MLIYLRHLRILIFSGDPSLHLEPLAGAVAVELGGVHALDVRDAGLVTPAVEDFHRVLEHVGALGQVVDEEMA